MRNTLLLFICTFLLSLDCLPQKDGILQPVPFQEVSVQDNFWLPRLKKQKETLVPFALKKAQPAIDNLQKTANYLKGIKDDLPFLHRYISSDLYKIMEGAAYLLTLQKDPALEKQMDEIIDIIGNAQQADGYLYESHITGVSKKADHWGGAGMGDKPYSWVLHSHELYNMGHMYEGAVAYYQATGKDKWLKIAEKNAKHINQVFFIGDPNYNNGKPVNQAPGHEEIELALVKLYRVTNDSLYLNMAKRFIDIRGVTFKPKGEGVMAPEYAQQHLPVREQTKAVGHAVRAAYLYSAMADVSSLTHDKSLRSPLDSIWHNIVDTRMHITGGLGAVHRIEGFGPEYVLPNKDAYNETCAAVGNVLFNQRMFLMEKDGKYMDVAEVALYNNVLAGVNLEGNKFFYVNPLEADGLTPFNHGKCGRSPWFGTACCPSNLARLIPQVSGLMYAHTKNEIFCSLYAGNSVSIGLDNGKIALQQKTSYPFDQKIEITVNPEKNTQKFTLNLRIPTWVGKQFVPGKLYQYANSTDLKWEIKVNGKTQKLTLNKGFAAISRIWKQGDKVELYLPMPVRYNHAIDAVKDDQGRICITKGPLVYCAEAVDNPFPVQSAFITEITNNESIKLNNDGILRGIDQIMIPAYAVKSGGIQKVSLTLIPYYAWDNRTDSSMIVWLPEKPNNSNYLNNRYPLVHKPYIELPLGSIKAKGWLLEMLQRQKQGATGKLDSLYPSVMGARNGWLGGDGDQWERGPYWIDGLLPLAYILDDKDLKQKAQPWIEWALNSQREDGFFGPAKNYSPEPGLQRDNSEDWWPRMVVLKILQQYYSATGDQRVIQFFTNYFKYQLKTLPEKPLGKWTFWAEYRACDNLQVVHWLYNITGDPFLLDLGKILHKQSYNFVDMFLNRDDLSRINTIHCVNLAQGIKEPVIFYQQDPDKKYLNAVKKAFSDIRKYHGQPQGMYGGDEALHGSCPTQGSELCSAVELMYSLEKMVEITGDLSFADHLEKVAFNALPTQISDDFMSRQYFQQPNQVIATRHIHNFDQNHGGTDNVFGLLTGYPCCTSNMHQGWPKFTQNLWYATPDNGLAALVFSPSEVTAKVGNGCSVTVTEETAYPMEDNIHFTIRINDKKTNQIEFPLHLRIPGWCKKATLSVNGEVVQTTEGGNVAIIKRIWKSGDQVYLQLPMHISLSNWYENSVAVERGPLVYALHVAGQWQKKKVEDDVLRYGESFEEVTPQSPWNYGLISFDRNKLDEHFKVTVHADKQKSLYPWNEKNAPIEIKVKAKQIPSWILYNEMAGPQPFSFMYGLNDSKIQEEEITLIPYGCTTLRITEFPVISR